MEAEVSGGELLYVVRAHDPSGIARVTVAWAADEPVWQASDLVLATDGQTWTGRFPARSKWVVQVVDNAGNVAIDDNSGLLYDQSASD